MKANEYFSIDVVMANARRFGNGNRAPEPDAVTVAAERERLLGTQFFNQFFNPQPAPRTTQPATR